MDAAPPPEADPAVGRLGSPVPAAELASRSWDVAVVGAGHNGLAAAAYLARAGRSVVVLERRDRVGGACTLEQPFEDARYLISPCAYVVGLLDETVVAELQLRRHGYDVLVCDPQLWCPLEGGRSLATFRDPKRTVAHMREQGFAERDIRGLAAYDRLYERLRRLLRSGPLGDTWKGESPTRAELEQALGDRELVSVVFEESIAETLDRYFEDERIKDALFGQGVIGTLAGPHDAGTSSIHLLHRQGSLSGEGGVWGYARGGIGRVSFAIAAAAREAGAVIACGAPVARILPGEGVELESGELVRARAVVSNADPKRTLAMLSDDAVPPAFRERVSAWRTTSPVVKLNAGLTRLPTFTAGDGIDPHRAMISITPGVGAAQEACEACRRGEPRVGFAELYFQTAYDASVAPPRRHTMSVFAQYAPYRLAEGDWEGRRAEIGEAVLDAVAVHAPDVRDCVAAMEVLGPPDIEGRIGLTGGHIFQGEALPDQMWDRRLASRTPARGLYLCGAATHPGGSVIALNGRNAAQAVLEDAA